jgi:hypothetical protein
MIPAFFVTFWVIGYSVKQVGRRKPTHIPAVATFRTLTNARLLASLRIFGIKGLCILELLNAIMYNSIIHHEKGEYKYGSTGF